MENVLLLDVGFGSLNKGDEIITECVKSELSPIFDSNFLLSMPTQMAAFDITQVMRNMRRISYYTNCRLKFVGGSNLAMMNMRHHYPQWNINILNYKPAKGCIFVGVGVGADEKSNRYTTNLYHKMLNGDFYHSVRDERSKRYLESLGLKAINTGCVTMWMLTPEHCASIPTKKSDKVVFTINDWGFDDRDQKMVDILLQNYNEVYFWPQGIDDFSLFEKMQNIENIHILPASKEAYDRFLTETDTDYVGMRLHGGIYAMRHKRRAIIIAIDERAKDINEKNNLNCIEKTDINRLGDYINSEFKTQITMPFDEIKRWKAQFDI